MMDQTVLSGEGAQFGTCAERLETLQTLPEWGYLFETLGALCRVLEIKAELGVRIHEAYRTGDKTALRAMLTELDETLVRLERFHDAYQAQWMQETSRMALTCRTSGSAVCAESKDLPCAVGGLLRRTARPVGRTGSSAA